MKKKALQFGRAFLFDSIGHVLKKLKKSLRLNVFIRIFNTTYHSL